MNKVIVSGANGFIGKALIKKLLEQNINVFAIVRDKVKLTEFKNYKNLNIIECELNSYSELINLISKDNYDVFYHLAWDGVFGEKFRNYELQLDNVKYACNALEAAQKIGCKKFLLVGTMNELEVRALMNNDTYKPKITCIYGTAKLASEMICRTLACNEGIEFNSVLLAMVYGEGDKSEMLPKIIIRNMIKNNRPKLVSGNYLYDWIYINDVVDGIIAVANKGINLKTYYLGHRKLKTFRKIVEEVRDILSPDMKLVFGEYKDSSMIDYSLIDLEAAYKDIGFECEVDFEESILKTAEWIKKELDIKQEEQL